MVLFFLLIYIKKIKNHNPSLPISDFLVSPLIEGHMSQIPFLQHLPYCYVLLLCALPLYRKFA